MKHIRRAPGSGWARAEAAKHAGSKLRPGAMRKWVGEQIYTEPKLGIRTVVRCSPGGIALVITTVNQAVEFDGRQDINEFALILVSDQCALGWAPVNWLVPFSVKSET